MARPALTCYTGIDRRHGRVMMATTFVISSGLATACRTAPERAEWLLRLPGIVGELAHQWAVTIGTPFAESSCSWVAAVTRQDGDTAVLKVAMPHMEALHETEGLRFWDGDPAVRLLEADENLGAMLLERCEPGTTLRALPEDEQDLVIAAALRRLWRRPPATHRFRPLLAMLAHWSDETRSQRGSWIDEGLALAGLRMFEDLARPSESDVVLATDLHAGNVLRARRAPWLVIDPKPFVGDPAYDTTQHLLNCLTRLDTRPLETVRRLADLAEVNAERVRLWLFARAAAEPRPDWTDDRLTQLARKLSV
jgi:streptomycin 6-kinase